MDVHNATVADVALCERIDPVFRTRHVWKVEHQVEHDLLAVSFQRARLPKEEPVAAPYGDEDLFSLWQRCRCFLVAEEGGLVLGYLTMYPRGASDEGWVSHLVVADASARRGVASGLLEGAELWGRENHLTSITVAAQNRNDPLIQLLPKRGYGFRGFMESYFPAGDAALLFTLAL